MDLESLVSAAEEGNTEDFKKSLACFDSLDHVFAHRNEEGYTLLHIGAKHGHTEIVKLLLDNEFPIEAGKAAIHGDADPLDGVTALATAVSEDKEEVVKLLIEKGANIHAWANRYGISPLCFAAMAENKQVIQLLIDNGALSPLERNPIDDRGLFYVHFPRKTEIFKFIFDRETDKGRIFNYPLLAAVERSDIELVEYILNREDPKVDDKSLSEVFCRAARFSSLEILKFLMSRGAKVNCISPSNYRTPLINSAGNEDKDTFQYLLDHGAEINARAKNGANALFIAAETTHPEVLELAIEYGGDINVIVDNRTALAASLRWPSMRRWQTAEILVRDILLFQFFGFPVNEQDLQLINTNERLGRFQADFEEELEKDLDKMKDYKLPDTSITLFDFATERNLTQLAAYANNNDVSRALRSDEVVQKFPRFASKVRKLFDKGVERNFLLKRVCCFFASLAGRKVDKLPKLPPMCVHSVYDCLTNQDLVNLRKAYF